MAIFRVNLLILRIQSINIPDFADELPPLSLVHISRLWR